MGARQGYGNIPANELQHGECDCKAALADNAAQMPEDWAQEVALLKDCSKDVETHCTDVQPGRAALHRCLA